MLSWHCPWYYLIHQNIGYIIISLLEEFGYTHEIFIIIPVIISIVLASIITFYIEKPIQKFLLNSLNKSKQDKIATKEKVIEVL